MTRFCTSPRPSPFDCEVYGFDGGLKEESRGKAGFWGTRRSQDCFWLLVGFSIVVVPRVEAQGGFLHVLTANELNIERIATMSSN